MDAQPNKYPIIDVVWHKPTERYYNIYLREGKIWPYKAQLGYAPETQVDPKFLVQKIYNGKVSYFWGDGQVFQGFFA